MSKLRVILLAVDLLSGLGDETCVTGHSIACVANLHMSRATCYRKIKVAENNGLIALREGSEFNDWFVTMKGYNWLSKWERLL